MKLNKGIWQFIKFVLVGISNTAISEGVYLVLIFFKVHFLPASFIGFSLSVLNAYYWSSRYVFQEKEDGGQRVWWKVLTKTYVAYFWGYLVNAGLLIFWIDILHIAGWMGAFEGWFLQRGLARFDAEFLGDVAAAGLNLLITVPMNFVVNKYWAYKNK